MPKFERLSNHLLMMCLLCAVLLLGGCRNSGPSIAHPEGEHPDPVLRWKVELGERLLDNPTIADGVLYIASDTHVYALDASTGETRWKFAPSGSALSSPAVANSRVYFGAKTSYNMNTRMATITAYALDVQTGNIKWQHQLSNDRSEDASNPIVEDGLVYFGTGWSDFSCCEFRGAGGRITALDAGTGQLVWQIESEGHYGSGGIPSTAFAVAGGMLYYSSGYDIPDAKETQLHALDARTGKEVWNADYDVASPLPASDGALYLILEREVERELLISIDGKTGQEKWRWGLDATGASLSRPAVVGDTVYVVSNQERDLCFEGPCPPAQNHTDTLHALDPATGKEKWKQDIVGGYYSTRDMVPFQQYLCYGLADYTQDTRPWYLRAIDRNDGKFKWQFKLEDSISGLPAADGTTLYIRTYDGIIYAIQPPD